MNYSLGASKTHQTLIFLLPSPIISYPSPMDHFLSCSISDPSSSRHILLQSCLNRVATGIFLISLNSTTHSFIRLLFKDTKAFRTKFQSMTDPALSDLGLCPVSSLRTFSFVALSPRGAEQTHFPTSVLLSHLSVSANPICNPGAFFLCLSS